MASHIHSQILRRMYPSASMHYDSWYGPYMHRTYVEFITDGSVDGGRMLRIEKYKRVGCKILFPGKLLSELFEFPSSRNQVWLLTSPHKFKDAWWVEFFGNKRHILHADEPSREWCAGYLYNFPYDLDCYLKWASLGMGNGVYMGLEYK